MRVGSALLEPGRAADRRILLDAAKQRSLETQLRDTNERASIFSRVFSRMFRHASNDGSDADSDDSISLTSTVFSEDDPDNTYIVENILAERWFSEEERTKYLVKWEGYPIERASWEPLEMFDDKNTINEWKALKLRRESGNSSPQFDWRQWDADREREAYDQQIRKMRRVKKRQRLQKVSGGPASSRASRASSAKVKTFVSGDEIVISADEESESDVQRPRRKRRRRTEAASEGTEEEEDSGNTSVDSLMETLARKAKRQRRPTKDHKATELKKRRSKGRGRRSVDEEGSEAEEEDWISEDQTPRKKVNTPFVICNTDDHSQINPTKPLNVTQNGRSTRPARKPSTNRDRDYEGSLAAATSTLSRMDVQPNKTSILANIMSKSGPRRRQPTSLRDVTLPGAAPLPGVPKVGKFISLSQANRMYKRSRNEPEPDINGLILFPVGEPKAPAIASRRLSGPSTEIRHLPHDAIFKSRGIIQPPGKSAPPDGEDPRGPKRRKTDEGPKVQTLSLDRYQATLAKRRDSAQQGPMNLPVPNAEPEAENSTGLAVDDDAMGMSIHEDAPITPAAPLGPSIDSWGAKKPPTGPAGWQVNRMDVDQPGSPDAPVKPTFECGLEIGLASNTETMGTVTFTGFTSVFTSFVEQLQIERLWVSRFLEDAYISNYLVPVSRRNVVPAFNRPSSRC